MYQLGLQYISITNLTKICHFMVQFLQNHMKNHREKTLHHFFSHLTASKKKFLWHTFLYGPKKLQEGFALFFLSFLSFKKEVTVHPGLIRVSAFMKDEGRDEDEKGRHREVDDQEDISSSEG